MRKIFQRISPATLFLIGLSAIGAFLRWKGLTFQSLWLDEIHTMLEAKPQYSLSEIVSFLSNTDPHPPFYFFLVHYWFEIFGYSDFSGRLLSMIVGTLTIPAAYFLGRELYSRSAGLICATFTAFNFYNIYYSQETRGYIFVFFLACLSFLYFVRALRAPDIRSAGAYVLVTALLVYTHYFGLILLVSQGLIFVIALIEENARKRRSLIIAGAFLAILLLYLPWVPVMWKLSQRDAFWIPAPRADFFVTYFWDYFGKDALTVYAFVFFLFLFAGSFLVSPKEDEPASFLNDRRALSFVVLVSWIWVIYIVAYVKSLVSVPLLLNRYTIIVVPAILLAAAIGVDSLRKPLIRFYLTALIVLFSIVHLFLYSHYYQTPTKTQWREMSDFIVKNNAREFPILTDREWYLPYYFGVTHYKPSYVQQDSLEKLNDLWIVTAHLGQPLTGFNKEIVNREFRVRKKFSGVDAFATLYSRQKLHIPIRGVVRRPDGYYALFNNGILTSEPLQLNPGRYKVAVYGYGTIAKGEFPKVALSMNGKTLTIFDLQQEKDYTCILDKTDNGDAVFSLEFRNDANGDGEDRNVFVKFFDVQRLRGR